MSNARVNQPSGFSLIELILTLLVVSFAASMIIPFFNSGVTTSSTPLFRMQSSANLQQTMDNLYAHFLNTSTTHSNRYTPGVDDPTSINPDDSGIQFCNDVSNNITVNGEKLVPDDITVSLTPSSCTDTSSLASIAQNETTVTAKDASGTPSSALVGYDPNGARIVTLTNDIGEQLTYVFVNGSNY